MKNIKILDCTLRDGGLGLEDSYKNQISTTHFSKKQIYELINHLNKTNIDIIELGSVEISKENKTRFCIYQSIEEVSKLIPENKSPNQMYVALFRGPDTPIENIPNWNPSLVEGIRVIIRYSELQKSLDFCAALAKKGYKVFVQPMLTMRYTDEELKLIINESNKMGAYACYFVDSYGYMDENDINRFFNYYNDLLNNDILIGFHAHNNMNLAYANVLAFMNIAKGKRNIIIDSCSLGMGQGAGNLQTELITHYLNNFDDYTYNFEEILEVSEIIDTLQPSLIWGFSLTCLLPALLKTAYKFSISLRNNYKMSYKEIYRILKSIPEKEKQRYTPEELKTIVQNYKKNLN